MLKEHYDSDFTEDSSYMGPIGTRDRILKQRQNLQSDPTPNQLPEKPPWLLKDINICGEGAIAGRQNTSTALLKQDFGSHLEKQSNTRHKYTDGSKS